MSTLFFVSGDILVHTNMEQVVLEIHNLAYFYHWSREECWNTPCTQRGVFNDQIRKQLKAESSGNSGSNSGTQNTKGYKESR